MSDQEKIDRLSERENDLNSQTTGKKSVNIRIESISPDQTLVQSVAGDLYIKGSTFYLRYPEPDPEMGPTTTTVKVKYHDSSVTSQSVNQSSSHQPSHRPSHQPSHQLSHRPNHQPNEQGLQPKRLPPPQISVIRHGTLESEQMFTEHEAEWGFYHMTSGKLVLQTRTLRIDANLDENGLGTLSWIYDLNVSNEEAGQFELKLNIQEEQAK